MKQIVIFDFDGTIADSFEAAINVFELLTKRESPLSAAELAALRGLPLLTVVERLNVPFWKIPFLLWRGRRMMSSYMKQVQPFAGMPELIEQLYNQGHTLYVMSSNSTHNVRHFLLQHHLNTYFQEVQGNVGIFGKGRAIRRFIKRHALSPSNCVYVGDEPRDVEGAHYAGIECIVVGWGFADREFLGTLGSKGVARTPQALYELLQ